MKWLAARWRELSGICLVGVGVGFGADAIHVIEAVPDISGGSWSIEPTGAALAAICLTAAALLLTRRI